MRIVVPVVSLAVAIAAILIGAFIGGRSYVVVSAIVVLCAIVPFFVRFEQRKPQAREVVMLAVMSALAVAARAAFIWVPHFKPMAGIVMITGMAFGPSAGFLVGAISALASDFIFGIGAWTPWQMLAFGLCGLVFGLLSGKRDGSSSDLSGNDDSQSHNAPSRKMGLFPRSDLSWKQLLGASLLGGLFIILIAGPILDTSSLFYMIASITPESAIAVYVAGFPINCIHGASTFLTILVLANPILGQLSRVRKKYGMLE